MLTPHYFSFADSFVRVPFQKEILWIKAIEERVKPALAKSAGGPCGENQRTWASSEMLPTMSQQGDDGCSNFCCVCGKVWLGFFCLFFFLFLIFKRGRGGAGGDPLVICYLNNLMDSAFTANHLG